MLILKRFSPAIAQSTNKPGVLPAGRISITCQSDFIIDAERFAINDAIVAGPLARLRLSSGTKPVFVASICAYM